MATPIETLKKYAVLHAINTNDPKAFSKVVEACVEVDRA